MKRSRPRQCRPLNRSKRRRQHNEMPFGTCANHIDGTCWYGSHPFPTSNPKGAVERLPTHAPPVLLIGYDRTDTLARNSVPVRKLFDPLACFISSYQRSVSDRGRDLASHSVPNFILSE